MLGEQLARLGFAVAYQTNRQAGQISDLLARADNRRCYVVAAHDTAENIDDDNFDFGQLRNLLKALQNFIRRGSAANIQEISSKVLAVVNVCGL